MYCPKCNQQQVSDDIRFCPRCGFQLDAVKLLLADNQPGSALTEAEPHRLLTSTRKRDILLGATIMLVGTISIALLTISTISGTPLLAVIIPLLLLWAAIVAVLLLSGHFVREVTKLFSKDASTGKPQASASLMTRVSAAAHHQALPAAQSIPLSGAGAWRVNTAELERPPSVTEHTTNLLDKK